MGERLTTNSCGALIFGHIHAKLAIALDKQSSTGFHSGSPDYPWLAGHFGSFKRPASPPFLSITSPGLPRQILLATGRQTPPFARRCLQDSVGPNAVYFPANLVLWSSTRPFVNRSVKLDCRTDEVGGMNLPDHHQT